VNPRIIIILTHPYKDEWTARWRLSQECVTALRTDRDSTPRQFRSFSELPMATLSNCSLGVIWLRGDTIAPRSATTHEKERKEAFLTAIQTLRESSAEILGARHHDIDQALVLLAPQYGRYSFSGDMIDMAKQFLLPVGGTQKLDLTFAGAWDFLTRWQVTLRYLKHRADHIFLPLDVNIQHLSELDGVESQAWSDELLYEYRQKQGTCPRPFMSMLGDLWLLLVDRESTILKLPHYGREEGSDEQNRQKVVVVPTLTRDGVYGCEYVGRRGIHELLFESDAQALQTPDGPRKAVFERAARMCGLSVGTEAPDADSSVVSYFWRLECNLEGDKAVPEFRSHIMGEVTDGVGFSKWFRDLDQLLNTLVSCSNVEVTR